MRGQTDNQVVTLDSFPHAVVANRDPTEVPEYVEYSSNQGDLSMDQRYDCPFQWFREQPDKATWADIAHDYLIIPAMSAEVERVFSRYRITADGVLI